MIQSIDIEFRQDKNPRIILRRDNGKEDVLGKEYFMSRASYAAEKYVLGEGKYLVEREYNKRFGEFARINKRDPSREEAVTLNRCSVNLVRAHRQEALAAEEMKKVFNALAESVGEIVKRLEA